MKKRILSLLLCIMLCLSLLPAGALADGIPEAVQIDEKLSANDESTVLNESDGTRYERSVDQGLLELFGENTELLEIPYSFCTYDTKTAKLICTNTSISKNNVTVLNSSMTTWNSGWYVVDKDVTFLESKEQFVKVNGDVHLILMDGCTLTCEKGICVEGKNSLTIYGQDPDSSSPGKLIAIGTRGDAGIGSWENYYSHHSDASCGTINIHGGDIQAAGGVNISGNSFGAGIGGGNAVSGGTVNIYGGIVTTEGVFAAGIGGGCDADGGTLNLYGGTVNSAAYGIAYTPDGLDKVLSSSSAAIGGSNSQGDSGTLNIYGGTVNAQTRRRCIGGTINVASNVVLVDAKGASYVRDFNTPSNWTAWMKGKTASFTATPKSNFSYIDHVYDDEQMNYVPVSTPIGVSAYLDENSKTLSDGWYIMDGIGTIDSVTVNGDAKLVLMNGCDLTVSNGIRVEGRGKLAIYRQIEGDMPMGKLTVSGSPSEYAGIGGGFRSKSTIAIHGGEVTATGGKWGAGIGGGWSSIDYDITIYDGIVHAFGGSESAGIGGGEGSGDGTISILGGSVYAFGGDEGAGIGGGSQSSGGAVTISGGSVEAYGGYNAAGIGSGLNGGSVVLTINGGTVNATGGGNRSGIAEGAGIGSGTQGSTYTSDHGTIVVKGGLALVDEHGQTYDRSFGSDFLTAHSVYFTTEACESLRYVDHVFDFEQIKYVPVDKNVGANTYLSKNTKTWTNGWYVMDGTGTIDSVSVNGDAKLLLLNGCDLTVSNGIRVESGNRLTIYRQAPDSQEMGKLTVTGSPENCAGIGGSDRQNSGEITIHGGEITATGGKFAAGIGGGIGTSNYTTGSGTVMIIDGVVKGIAGTQGAGIGGGWSGNGIVRIFGGTISAYGGRGGGAGIGGGYRGKCDILISGGTVAEAKGGDGTHTPMILFGKDFGVSIPGGQGIGTGYLGSDGHIIIKSSTVECAVGGSSDETGNAAPGDGIQAPAVWVSPYSGYKIVIEQKDSESKFEYSSNTLINGEADNILAGRKEIAVLTCVATEEMTSGKLLVHFDNRGGAYIAPQLVAYGEKATDPGVQSDGSRQFLGWYTDPDFTTLFDFETPITSEIVLYAKWINVAPEWPVPIGEPAAEDKPFTMPFTDVAKDTYYFDAVQWAVKNGITNGTSETKFSPDAPVTRAQVVTFLWRAANCPAAEFEMNMADVENDAWYTEAVRWALSEGITKGTSETTFSPDMICTRAQIVTFLARYAGVKDAETESAFSDVAANDFFAAAVKWAKDNGVTDGTSKTTFSPFDTCTRAQAVTFLWRLMSK